MDREILPNIKDTSPLRRYPPMKSQFESHRAVRTCKLNELLAIFCEISHILVCLICYIFKGRKHL